jgi:signal transduction histidine kinase
VRIIKQNSTMIAEVKDEGPGFDLEAVMSNYSSRASLGLLNMQERAAMVGGEFKIETAPGKGTTVSIAVPVNGA